MLREEGTGTRNGYEAFKGSKGDIGLLIDALEGANRGSNRGSKEPRKTRGALRGQTRFAGRGLPSQRAPKQCPINGVWRII